jgi:hypothetical protein
MGNDEQHHLWPVLGAEVQFLRPTLENPASQGKPGFRMAMLLNSMAVPDHTRKEGSRGEDWATNLSMDSVHSARKTPKST